LTVNTNHVTARSVDHRLSLWTQWIALRKGYLHNGDGILSPTFTAHLPGSGARAAHQDAAARQDGRAELLAWAAGVRAGFSAFDLSVEVGPILGVGLVAGRWVLSGIARSTGAVVTSAGVDIIRVDGGRIVELWISHDHVDPAITRSA
jgi:hypothetical protein